MLCNDQRAMLREKSLCKTQDAMLDKRDIVDLL